MTANKQETPGILALLDRINELQADLNRELRELAVSRARKIDVLARDPYAERQEEGRA